MNRNLLKLIILIVLSLCACVSFANKIQAPEKDYLLLPSDYYSYQDTSTMLNFEVVQKKQFVIDSTLSSVKNGSVNYWFLFCLDSVFKDKKYVFEVISPHTEWLSFYVPVVGDKYREYHTGHLKQYTERAYLHKNFVFDIPNDFDSGRPFYLKINSRNKVGFLFKVREQAYFTSYSIKEYLLLGIYYGILIALAVYNFLIFLILRKSVYLWYVLTVLAACCITLSDDGLGFAYLWPNTPILSRPLGLYVFPVIYLTVYSLYAYHFIDSKFSKPRKIMLSSMIVYITYMVLHYFIVSEFHFSSFFLFHFLLIYAVYIYVYMHYRYRPAMYFLIGNTFMILGLIIYQMRLMDLIVSDVYRVYAFNYGVVLEFISLSLSLASRYREDIRSKESLQQEKINTLREKDEIQQNMMLLLKEKDELTQKVNKELEDKVARRTADLNQSNHRLQQLVNDLESMSIELDKENWKLKKVIKEEKTSNLLGENLSYEVILELFPTKQSCLTFLNKRKWETKTYVCHSCKSRDYSESKADLSRKCKKCGHIESVTAGSLFHAQKIPLQKLFYLTYLAHKNSPIDVVQLATYLELSENSLYKFFKKTREKSELRKTKAATWIDTIFD